MFALFSRAGCRAHLLTGSNNINDSQGLFGGKVSPHMGPQRWLLPVCVLGAAAGIIICLIRDLLPKRAAKWVPSPMAMSIPFYIGAASVSDECSGPAVQLAEVC